MAEIQAYDRDLGRAHSARFDDLLQRMAEARAGVAALLGTETDAVALTHATTDGMNAASLLPDWRSGGRMVTTMHEHPATLGVLYALRDRTTATLTMVDAGDDGDDARTLAAFDAAITPGTRLVSISHVLWTTGAVMPVAAIAALAHERGAMVIVDGAQASGAIPVGFGALGVDAYALPAQKWLLGPEAMGALVIDRAAIGQRTPALAGWFSFGRVDGRGVGEWWPDARRFESSGYQLASVAGMARSIGWLAMYVGLDFVYRRGMAMARFAAARLDAISGVTVLTPRQSMATLVTFVIDGWPARSALDELGARVFVIARTIESLDALRISPAFFTTEEEIERLADAVALLAAHTPETLPPRRTLSLLGDP